MWRSRTGARGQGSGVRGQGFKGDTAVEAQLIDGTAIGKAMRAELAGEIEALAQKGVKPGLAVVLVGENPASQVYVRMKGKACEEAGMHSETIRLPADTSEADLLAVVDRLNADPTIDGMLVLLPLPKNINA